MLLSEKLESLLELAENNKPDEFLESISDLQKKYFFIAISIVVSMMLMISVLNYCDK